MENEIIKVLICDDSAQNGVRMASKLREMGVYAYTRSCEEASVLNSILSDKPDVVIAELSMQDTDAVSVMEKANSLLSESPAFIVVSEIANGFIERQIISCGAAYFLVKPFDAERLYDVVRSVLKKKPSPDCADAELMVTDMIRRLGVPAHIKGYRYVRTGILECINDRSLLDSITKRLYPYVAERYSSTPSRVERAIRHAIETAWERGDRSELNSFFGYDSSVFGGRPTNSEFIALVADRVRLQMKISTVSSRTESESERRSRIRTDIFDMRTSL